VFWLVLLLFIATTVIGELLTPKPKVVKSGLGDFNFPTAQEGRAIPVVGGTVNITGGNTVWWGDLLIRPILTRESIIAFSSTITGYKYYIGVQYALCWGPVDSLQQINADAKSVPYTVTPILNGNGSENYLQLLCTGYKLYGGTGVGGEGGFSGTLDFYRGLATQQPNDYLTRVQGRIAYTPGTIPYTFSGVGNGTMSFLSGGAASKVETIVTTATGIVHDNTSPYYLKMKFSCDGSVSGHIGSAYADFPFSSPQINFTIATGSIQFDVGDEFTVKTLHAFQSPAYKNLCYAVMEQCYTGITNQPKPMEFIVTKCPDPFGQGASIANLGGDCNAPLFIYDFMTNAEYGLGLNPATFDVPTWKAAAVTLAGEGLGISVTIDTPDTADTILGEVLRHVDGIVQSDPFTGLWTFKLNRFDYDPTTLEVIDKSCVLGTPDYQRGSWSETSNYVLLNYLSKAADFNTRTVQSYDPANILVTQEVRQQTVDYSMLSNATAASLVLMRVLRTFTFPLGKLKIEVNRNAWNFRMGGVFKFTWTPLGIENMIFRITHIGYGEVSKGKITIDAVEDIFGIEGTTFVSPPVSGWVNPLGAPVAPAQQKLIEIPYHILIADKIVPGTFVGALAARGDGTSQTFQIWKAGAESVDAAMFSPCGTLAADYGLTSADDPVGFSITGPVDALDLVSGVLADLNAGNFLCMMDGELMAWETVTPNLDGSFTFTNVRRAVMDTVPVLHVAGTVVWFLTNGLPVTSNAAIADNSSETDQLLPENPQGVFPIGSATPLTIATAQRYLRPYPPAGLSVNGAPFYSPPAVTTGADLVLAWLERNRLTQAAAGTMVKQDDPTITPEVGTTYTAKIYNAGVLIRTVAGIAVPTYTYTLVQHATDGGTNPVLIEISSNANSLDSTEAWNVSLTMNP
jgi:Putative phage tail protein